MGSLIQLWLAIRPIRRIREARQARKAEAAALAAVELSSPLSTPLESGATATGGVASIQAATVAQVGTMGELGQSMLRSMMKVLGTAVATYAVTHGLAEAGQMDALTVALETVGGGLLTIGGIWLSHKTHAPA